jgi:hypothetical protein
VPCFLAIHVARRLRECREDATGVKPAHTETTEDVLPVDVARPELGRGTVPAIRAADRAANAEAPLREVQPVAHGATDAVGWHPLDQRGVDASLENQVLQQEAHLVADAGSDHRRPLAEAPPQTAGHVVLAAALPHPKLAGAANPALTRIQTEHDLPQGENVVPAGSLRLRVKARQRRLPLRYARQGPPGPRS